MAGVRATTALLLACRVVLALEMPGNFANLPQLAARATTEDPAVTACSIAYAVVDSCYSASPGLSTAAASDVASCVCCHSTVEIDAYYSSCADYIAASFPESSTDYDAFVTLAGACAADMPTCGAGAGGGGGASATTTPARTTARTTASATRTGSGGGAGATDAACNSLDALITSCIAATPSITAAPNSVAASCLCYANTDGTPSFTTELDDLASSCAPWAKTNLPGSVYSFVTGFEDFCAQYTPAGGGGGSTTRTRTTSSGGGFGGGAGGPNPSTTTTSSKPTATSTAPLRPPSGNVAPKGGPGGLVVWAAEMFSVALSFFLLM